MTPEQIRQQALDATSKAHLDLALAYGVDLEVNALAKAADAILAMMKRLLQEQINASVRH